MAKPENKQSGSLKITDIKPLGIDLKEQARLKIIQSKDNEVFDEIIDEYKIEQKEEYKEFVKKGIKEYNTIVSELNKVKGDIEPTYDENGIEKSGRRYSQELVDQINSKKKRAELIFNALHTSKETKNFKLLTDLYNKK